MSKFKVTCNICKSENVNLRPMIVGDGQPRIQARCVDCEAFDNLSLGGDNFTMPFGKHVGKMLDEIYLFDTSYLTWVAENFSNDNIKNRVAEYLCRK